MNRFIHLIACLWVCAGLAACSNPVDEPEPEVERNQYRIVGYVHSAAISSADAARLTHINYAFANVRDSTVVLESGRDATNLDRLARLKLQYPNLKILLSVGGWDWSANFSDAALTPTSREQFARSAVDLMVAHNLDGLDIDWEYPGQKGKDNVYRPEDKENFTLLLERLRVHLDEQSLLDGRGGDQSYELTIATGANAAYLAHTDLRAAQVYLDAVNVMTYDFHGGWSNTTGHHANLFPSQQAGAFASAEGSTYDQLQAGVPRNKLVLGVAFYGYEWADVDSVNHGLYQSFVGETATYSFSKLRAAYIDQNGFERHWDEAAKAPYLWNADAKVFISYEDEQSLEYKAEYVRSQGFGGIMYWEHSHDLSGSLLQTLHQGLNGGAVIQP